MSNKTWSILVSIPLPLLLLGVCRSDGRITISRVWPKSQGVLHDNIQEFPSSGPSVYGTQLFRAILAAPSDPGVRDIFGYSNISRSKIKHVLRRGYWDLPDSGSPQRPFIARSTRARSLLVGYPFRIIFWKGSSALKHVLLT
jgi:hypothetical protein